MNPIDPVELPKTNPSGSNSIDVSNRGEVPDSTTGLDSIANLEVIDAIDSDSFNSVQIVDGAPASTGTPSGFPRRTALGMSWEVLKLFLVPTLILTAFVAGIAILGQAQRLGWLESPDSDAESNMIGATSQETEVTYICPMMCVPPTTKPGRCPVCAMELVPAATSSSSGPSSTIQIDSRSRRVAGITTVAAKSQTLYREVRGVGEISFDESKLKTLSAYIDGRIEELFADYTGVKVNKGDSLAQIYSPELYGAQVEFVKTLQFADKSANTNERVADSNRRLLESSRERLLEFGLTEEQVQKIEQSKTAQRRIELHAPINGTVIEKIAVTGQYIKSGEPIYRLADLGTVWLVLQLFPADAHSIKIGQPVIATTQSMPGATFEGTVEFVEPTVDPKMRTVGIRVAIDNQNGNLKPGEFARATLKIPLRTANGVAQQTVVVPRNSLLSIGPTSLAYVETKPGEFELRRVTTGPTVDNQIAILDGIVAGEQVVSRATFLVDAQMQLQGNPSLMDPDKAVMSSIPELDAAALEGIRVALEPLSIADRKLVEEQGICPVTEARLGSMGMGTPIKMEAKGTTVFICCEGCRKSLNDEPEKYFQILEDYQRNGLNKPVAGTNSSLHSNQNVEQGLPQMELPTMKLPKLDLPKMEIPKAEVPHNDPPKMDLPKLELPKMEFPKPEKRVP